MAERGEKIDGRYELVAPLDDRGVGECWRARDGRVKGRVVMVRLLRALADKAAVLPPALKALSENLRQLRHPSIVTTHEAGCAKGRPYLIHDLFEGPSLGAGLDKARGAGAVLSTVTIRLFFERALGAVEVGHLQAAPVFHGAIGPGHVFVQRLPGASFDVRVAGFGLLPWVDPPTASPGSTRGLLWSAPEQALTAAPARAVDVYQLGRLLELMLTSPTSDDGFHDEAPRALAEVLARATHDDPSARFETVAKLREATLRAFDAPAPAVISVPAPAPAPHARAATMIAPKPARPVVRAETRAAPRPERAEPVVVPPPVRVATQVAAMPERTQVTVNPVRPETRGVAMQPGAEARWGSREVHEATVFTPRVPEASAPESPATSVYAQGFGGSAPVAPDDDTRRAFREPAVPVAVPAPAPHAGVTAVVTQDGSLFVANFNDALNPWDADALLPFHAGLEAVALGYAPTVARPHDATAVITPRAADAPASDREIIVKTAVYGVLGGGVLLALAVGAYFTMR